MFYAIYAVLALIGLYILILRIEKANHEKRVNSIPVRIWVNGSRGKSSVTRLIAAGLRGGGMKVIAKTTGTRASYITDNSREQPVLRLGMPNIREQIKIFRKAAAEKPDAIVLECMALRPDLQYTESVRIVDPTTVVITNIRADHLDVMGPTIKDIARHFVEAIPDNSTLFAAENSILRNQETNLHSRQIKAHFSDADRVADTIVADFHYIEHKANVALALDVCKDLGVDENTALDAMRNAAPDPGVLRRHALALGQKQITLVNAMAANDPDSTFLIWQMIDRNYPEINILVNCRIDRIDRSFQMARLILERMPADHYILTGSGTHILARKLLKAIKHEKVIDLSEKMPEHVVQIVADTVSNGALIFAMGNTVGYGEKMMKQFLLHEGKNS